MHGSNLFTATRRCLSKRCFIEILLVLHIVAVKTEQLPVAAVRRVVIVVMVLVMDREFAEFFPFEFPSAPRAD